MTNSTIINIESLAEVICQELTRRSFQPNIETVKSVLICLNEEDVPSKGIKFYHEDSETIFPIRFSIKGNKVVVESRVKDSPYYFKFDLDQKREGVFNVITSVTEKAKSVYQGLKLKALLKKLKAAQTPTEAFNLVVEFVGASYMNKTETRIGDYYLKSLIDFNVKKETFDIEIVIKDNETNDFGMEFKFHCNKESLQKAFNNINALLSKFM